MNDCQSVNAVEWTIIHTNVIETKIYRTTLISFSLSFIVEKAVNVVVDGLVIDHLSDRHIEEVSGIIRAFEILGEYLHEHRFPDTHTTL